MQQLNFECQKKRYTEEDHSFVICAYKESPYLEECIRSLIRATDGKNVLMVTSTPNCLISEMAAKYKIPLYVREGASSIAKDWDFGLSKAGTKLVTIAHQDDLYHLDYRRQVVRQANKIKDPIILFTDYGEIRDGKKVLHNRLLRIKRLMLLPITPRIFQHSKRLRRMILSFGSPISCPSVCYVMDRLVLPHFHTDMKVALDWASWEELSRLEGSFGYVAKPLMMHRIHEDSETSHMIRENVREKEELEMYKRFWPAPVAKHIEKFYNKGMKSNQLK